MFTFRAGMVAFARGRSSRCSNRSGPASHRYGERVSEQRGKQQRLPWGTLIVAGLFAISGTTHVLAPEVFTAQVPDWLPAERPIILVSGLVELVCAVGLLTRQRWAPVATSVTLAVIWVGNWDQAIQLTANGSAGAAAIAWVRLPLQILLIYWALRSPVKD